ncbi:hypothetical protein [Candidatus Rhodobacter oscarellae]|uniref:hypothetical protein n=1 Tax=Candidatus Rhodobacter oscarellae TaxID=1675527 RepID=UPI000670A1F2|nr:hypothetical protein [Candidatus Rhodobacter lobularis]
MAARIADIGAHLQHIEFGNDRVADKAPFRGGCANGRYLKSERVKNGGFCPLFLRLAGSEILRGQKLPIGVARYWAAFDQFQQRATAGL